MQKKVDWNHLKAMPAWCPLSSLKINLQHVEGDLYCIEEHAYLFAVPTTLHKTPGKGPFVTIVLWAQSEGAARRAMLRQIEADLPQIVSTPPSEMLIAPECANYGNLTKTLKRRGLYRPFTETACYRIATDGAFLYRKVVAGAHIYMFRNMKSVQDEVPFAIQFELPDREKKTS